MINKVLHQTHRGRVGIKSVVVNLRLCLTSVKIKFPFNCVVNVTLTFTFLQFSLHRHD